MQEIDLNRVFETRDNSSKQLFRTASSYLNSRVELDIALDQLPKDKLRNNDDYQLLNNNGRNKASGSAFVSVRAIDAQNIYTIKNSRVKYS